MGVEKTFYLCRHGETESSVTKVIQGFDEPLTEKGMMQSKLLAWKMTQIVRDTGNHIENVYSSPALRACQTAEHIGGLLNKDVVILPELHECLHPTHMHGRPVSDPDVAQYIAERATNFCRSVRIFDEETYEMTLKRAMHIEQFFRNSKDTHSIVVSHGIFITYLLGVMRHGNALTPYILACQGERLQNCTSIKVEYGTFPTCIGPRRGWRIWLGGVESFDSYIL